MTRRDKLQWLRYWPPGLAHLCARSLDRRAPLPAGVLLASGRPHQAAGAIICRLAARPSLSGPISWSRTSARQPAGRPAGPRFGAQLGRAKWISIIRCKCPSSEQAAAPLTLISRPHVFHPSAANGSCRARSPALGACKRAARLALAAGPSQRRPRTMRAALCTVQCALRARPLT